MLKASKKPRKLSNNEKAVGFVTSMIRAGAVLTIHASSGYYTIGAYTPAVGPHGFAVYGYGGYGRTIPAREFVGYHAAHEAAWAIVDSCGSTRAREAAIAAALRG